MCVCVFVSSMHRKTHSMKERHFLSTQSMCRGATILNDSQFANTELLKLVEVFRREHATIMHRKLTHRVLELITGPTKVLF